MSVRIVKEEKESRPNLEGIDNRLDKLQDEYLQLILNMEKDGSPLKHKSESKSEQFVYRWKRLKILQEDIFQQIVWKREESIRNAKLALEEAFTPHLKKMLSESLEKNKDSIMFEGVRYFPEKPKEVQNDSNRDEENE